MHCPNKVLPNVLWVQTVTVAMKRCPFVVPTLLGKRPPRNTPASIQHQLKTDNLAALLQDRQASLQRSTVEHCIGGNAGAGAIALAWTQCWVIIKEAFY